MAALPALRVGAGQAGANSHPFLPFRLAVRTPIAPGRFLETRYMRPLRMSQDALAQALGVSRRRVNELVRGRRGVTPDTAIRLGMLFGTEPRFWMDLQQAWDMREAARSFRSSRSGTPSADE